MVAIQLGIANTFQVDIEMFTHIYEDKKLGKLEA